ncbi:xanthine dehydrogenase family protein subunit M [Pseudoxanthomonas mexicana]|uniref:FAD binding domain-containing protein n=1 Tax=Pseudoxanthomonas mexicana TaxID=128785 RepID=UPI000785F0EC
MNPFDLVGATDTAAARRALGSINPNQPRITRPQFLAGGTNVLDLMKAGVTQPPRLVSIADVGLKGITWSEEEGLRLGATAHNADTAYHPLVSQHAPLLASAILAGASPQIRNAATNGGNLLQRTRCIYFYDVALPCNKRAPGSGCSAIGGVTRQHAILGASTACIATHPSDMCVALGALGALVEVEEEAGKRLIPFSRFHRLPGEHPEHDTELPADALITAIVIPPNDYAAHSVYLKIRDRASYAFALVSVAVGLDLFDDGTVRSARIALGGVAHKPWRIEEAEALLAGERPSGAVLDRVADRILDGAVGQGGNDFKIELARRLIARGITVAARGTVTNDTAHTNEGKERPHG